MSYGECDGLGLRGNMCRLVATVVPGSVSGSVCGFVLRSVSGGVCGVVPGSVCGVVPGSVSWSVWDCAWVCV